MQTHTSTAGGSEGNDAGEHNQEPLEQAKLLSTAYIVQFRNKLLAIPTDRRKHLAGNLNACAEELVDLRQAEYDKIIQSTSTDIEQKEKLDFFNAELIQANVLLDNLLLLNTAMND